MSRYEIASEWSQEDSYQVGDDEFVLQSASLRDTNSGHVYREGAYRVLVNGKAPRGKGGTVPFKGESAWSAGARMLNDLYFAARRAG